MKRLGLRLQILVLLLGPLAAFAPATVLVIHYGLKSELSREIDARALAIAQQTALVVVDDVLTGERSATERRLADVRENQQDIAYVFVTDARGDVTAHTFSGGFPVDLLQVPHVRHSPGAPTRVLLGDQPVHDVAAPILKGLAGQVHVGIATRAAHAFSLEVLTRLSLIGLSIVALGVFLTFMLSNRMVQRLDRVAEAASAIGEGTLGTRIEDASTDEIGRLGRAFNRMAERLESARAERERTFLDLARSEKLVAVGRLAAGVAHEIRNPLAGVAHCLDNLLLDDGDATKRVAYYRLMQEGVARTNRVVGGLLNYAREHPLEVGEVDLVALVERVASLLEPGFRAQQTEVSVKHDEATHVVLADVHLMEQVVMNLLLNASEAMPDGGLIEVEISRQRGLERIRVLDRGIGIGPDDLGRIFDPFFTTKGGGKGSGLGLSVSLGIVERHRGRMEARARVNGGSVFDVFLPQNADPDSAADRAESP